MSNHLAIATVTKVLGKLLSGNPVLPSNDNAVTNLRPGDPQIPELALNIYLYQVTPNTALRNEDLPTRGSDGRVVRRPQAALDLFYLLTFFGAEEDLEPQRMLADAIRVLHDQPILTRENIIAAVTAQDAPTWLGESDLAEQVELVKFTLVPLDLEELSKLWSVFFETKYTLSVVYKASVVLIESDRPEKSTLPVLTRDVTVLPYSVVPLPTLESVQPPKKQPRAALSDTLTITGHHLDGETVKVILENRHQDVRHEFDIDNEDYTAETIKVVLSEAWDDSSGTPVAPEDWAVGVYTVWAEVKLQGEASARITNALSMLLAPRITIAFGSETLILTVGCSPKVRSGPYVVDPEDQEDVDLGGIRQRVSLLLGDREIPAHFDEWTDHLVFDLAELNPGEYYVRLRVDGVDSLFIDYEETPPKFIETFKVTIE